MALLDKRCKAAVKQAPHAAVAWYLMAGYAYEELDSPIISDACFDWLCDVLWDMLESEGYIPHSHAHLVNRDDLEAGTASGFVKYLPTMVKSAAEALLEEL